ncbi:hypothetical protein O6P43_003642 [Quillaja saponaria]|uniref:Uncharacterized protein n=1 Tax=Quillaja saponaria TaxID=32244 RepID=A0AAD7QF70_QUISA|nr:hypothetical protein O6P43_003642 [Quillaja saponaria]
MADPHIEILDTSSGTQNLNSLTNSNGSIMDSSHGVDLVERKLHTGSSELCDDMMLSNRCLFWKPAATPKPNKLSFIYPFPYPYSQLWPYSHYNNSGTQNLNGLTNSSGTTNGNLNHSVFQDYNITYNMYH